MIINRKNILNNDIALPADDNFSNNVASLGFDLDSRISYTKQVSSGCSKLDVIFWCQKFISSEIELTESH